MRVRRPQSVPELHGRVDLVDAVDRAGVKRPHPIVPVLGDEDHLTVPTIAAVLSHASEESTKQHMSVDDDRLLRCVLPVPRGARL